MVQENLVMLREVRANWSRVLAFAWLNQEVLEDLRRNPKQTITNLAMGGQYINLKGEVKENLDVDGDTAAAASTIERQAADPGESYRGYLPVPNAVGGLEGTTKENLAALLNNGITGILKFDDEAELWADELHAAWNDSDQLIKIRQDPSKNLRHAKELSNTRYGIFPIPDRPRGLEQLKIEQLQSFLGDQDHMEHIGGVFLLGS
jgi:hypothetical protein